MQRVLIIASLISLMMVAWPASAQQPNCGQLSDDECDTLYSSVQTFIQAGSFNNQTFQLELGGAGGDSDGNTVIITGSGPMQMDSAGRIVAADLSGSTTFDEDTSAERQFILLDNTVYLGEAGEFVGVDASTPEGQLVVDLATGSLLGTAFSVPNTAIPSRLPDEDIDGQTMQVYESNIDVVAFFSNEQVQLLIVALLQSSLGEQALGDFGMGEGGLGDLNQADLAGAVQLLPLLLSQDTFQVRQWVGAEDNQIYRAELELDWVLDASFIDPEIGETALSVLFTTDVTQHGEAFDITAPEDFEAVDELDIEGLFNELFPMPPANPGDEARQPDLIGRLDYGQTVAGELTAGNSEHVYLFRAEAGDVVTAEMTATQQRMDALLVLMDSDGAELARNDDHGTARADLAPFDALIADYLIGASGEYWLMATWPTNLRDGGYELTLLSAQ